LIWRFVNSLAFCVLCSIAAPFILYSLLVRNEERLQDYFAIRRCVRACADSEMLQVHTAQGCFCVSLPQQLFKPAERAP
jgi:hypothetical protein